MREDTESVKTLDDESSFDVPKRQIVNCTLTFGTVYYIQKWDERVESVKTLDGGGIFDVPKRHLVNCTLT